VSADLNAALAVELRRVADEHVVEAKLNAAVKHLLGRGKLYRPRLALATYEAITGSKPGHLAAAVVPLELIHTFTLIHDDLPCMDDAQLRRGVSAVHLEFNEATAVLAGDSLCDMAFQVLADSASGLTPELALQLIRELSSTTQSVVEGQMYDLAAEGQRLSIDAIEALQAKKTGALLGACCAFGAILAEAPAESVAALREVGVRLGVLFQLRDDLLSVDSTEAQAGKTLHTDKSLQKSTIVAVKGAEAARAYALGKEMEVLLGIESLNLKHPEPLLAVAREAFTRTH
jgi:geranylgeranyl pyrophosphate synthase